MASIRMFVIWLVLSVISTPWLSVFSALQWSTQLEGAIAIFQVVFVFTRQFINFIFLLCSSSLSSFIFFPNVSSCGDWASPSGFQDPTKGIGI